VPDRECVELKSLKLYLQAYRNRGIYYEHVTNVILDDLVAAMKPRRMTVEGDFRVRGGISDGGAGGIRGPGAGRGRARRGPRVARRPRR
jgi:7-cyano-7-deazaguanine reductase